MKMVINYNWKAMDANYLTIAWEKWLERDDTLFNINIHGTLKTFSGYFDVEILGSCMFYL